MKKALIKSLFISIVAIFYSNVFAQKNNTVTVPIAGNSYITQGLNDKISDKGIVKWEDDNTVISVWVKINSAGTLNLSLKASNESKSTIKISFGGQNFKVELNSKKNKIVDVGESNVSEGYLRIDFSGMEKSGNSFGDISDILLSGSATLAPMNFVDNFSAYWGRRGPSAHMKYILPAENVEYFYNEMTVPQGNDIIGSYFMANGFGEGYFGIQVNSQAERRILFSVWSPFDTQNPNDIPENMKIVTLRKGKDVHIGEFGNEGSGGQGYMRYNWIAGNTYKFLTQAKPDKKGNTIYTSYFYAPELSKWILITSFMRPKTETWYNNAHSFLENFIPEQGYIARKVLFGNEWARTESGKWIPVCKGIFTYDATANAKVRMDYAGGVENNLFFLKNCGFFDKNTTYKSLFERKNNRQSPEIDFEELEKL